MSRRYTRRSTALLLVLALLVSMLGAALPVMQKSGAASGTFATAYTALLEKAPVAQADLERDPYGLCRLVVTGYGGKDYGAVAAAVTDGLAILQYDTPLAARKAAVQLAQDGATAEPDSLCQLETNTNLTGNLCPWAGEMVGTTAFCARRQIPGHRVVIAQIDTGFMLDHPALHGRLVSDGIDLSGDGRANAAYDTRQRGATYWHATAVASVLAGNTDENVKILPYKVVRFGTDTCAASAVLAAMEDAVAKGARVLNMSLSTSQNRAGFAAMMDKAAALGVAVCCSAGNVGAQISNRYPSALPQAITVSAVTADKTVAGFSNYGDLVDYCAPGSHITVATMDSGGAPAATTASGTSLSCPYGAACCALLLSLHPDLTLDQLNALLQGSAEDLGDPGFDPIYGNGLLRLDNLTQTGTTGNLTYTLTLPEGTLALTGTGDGADYDRAAATPWALWAEELQQITVADTVTGLGNFTFSGCQNAVFTLPETLQRLGAYVFENCKGLHTITLPRNVEQVGTGAFSGCSDLTVRGWRNTPAPRAAAAAGAAFLPLGCVHNYVCQILRPTDTDPGSLTYTCARCGADLGTVELPPNGHTYSETVQTAPTCTATGRSNYTCTVCGDSYTADTPALGHNWVQRAYTAPTCCVAGREQRYCARCGTEETNILSPTQPEGHFVKGTVTDKAGAPLANISVSLDGTPVAVTNENGVFLFEGVPCGNYTLTFCGDGCVPRRVPLSVSGGNTTAPAAVLLLVGDLNGDGYVNARDDVLAQRQAVSPSDGANLSVNRVLPKVTLDRIYGVQAKIGVLYIRQSAEEDGAYRRQFEVNVRAFNEYRVVDCGFLYGKNMAETDLVPERVGATNAQGYAVKRMPAACTPGRKVLLYGSSSATGQVSARFYITYTNGVMTKTYLSEVCTYDYDEA